jgi:hypothetical protein
MNKNGARRNYAGRKRDQVERSESVEGSGIR